MLALGLTLGLFALWTAVGLGVLGMMRVLSDRILCFLLAPVVGVSLTVLAVFFINRLGVPLRTAGWPILLVLVVAAGLMLWRRRPELRSRSTAPSR